MGSYSPGDPASPDNEATRPLRAGTSTRGGSVPFRGNFFVRLRAAWKSMRNPEASPEELGYVPHLRSRLIAILVAALGIACLIIGLSTYVTLQNSLYQQAQSDLKETSHRVVQPTSRNGKREEVDCSDLQKSSSLFAPGQASGTIITCVESEGAVEIASKLTKDGTVQALSANDQVTLGTMALNATMKPLERVSAVATDVAHLDLEEHTISSAVRVEPRDSDPRTEVGAVGYALNQLLDNVNSALEVRERTEHQIRAFIADASHELRTPLAAIKGYSDMLRWTEPLSESGQSSLARIDSQAERMSRLVEDLLTLARLDEGREPKFEQVDLTELVLECTSDMQAAARTHEWHLNLPDEPVEVVADRSQIQRVILNLLSNARKHTDEGTRVTAGLAVDAARREAVVTVTDNGPGIAPDFLPKIFDRFTRADKARSGSDGTTGLGLAIVQAIVQAHGGSIQVQSQPGHTVFTVRLPLDVHLQPVA